VGDLGGSEEHQRNVLSPVINNTNRNGVDSDDLVDLDSCVPPSEIHTHAPQALTEQSQQLPSAAQDLKGSHDSVAKADAEVDVDNNDDEDDDDAFEVAGT
jgi:hypothetical protein